VSLPIFSFFCALLFFCAMAISSPFHWSSCSTPQLCWGILLLLTLTRPKYVSDVLSRTYTTLYHRFRHDTLRKPSVYSSCHAYTYESSHTTCLYGSDPIITFHTHVLPYHIVIVHTTLSALHLIFYMSLITATSTIVYFCNHCPLVPYCLCDCGCHL